MSATTSPIHPSPGDTDDVLGRSRADLVAPPDSFVYKLAHTDASFAPTIGRLGLGLIMLPHVLQKVFGLFGGYGLPGTYQAFTHSMGIPGPLAALAIFTEITATLALLLGIFTRAAALGILAVMVGAIAYVHAPYGFFMNWYGQAGGEGFEYHLLAITLAIVAMIAGGGKFSLDRLLMQRRPMTGGSVDESLTHGTR